MSKSILQTERECWATRLYFDEYRGDHLHEHHVFENKANKPLSEHYGLKVYLTYDYHEGEWGIHRGNVELDRTLKQYAQREFEKRYGHEKFMEVFGKNYLD